MTLSPFSESVHACVCVCVHASTYVYILSISAPNYQKTGTGLYSGVSRRPSLCQPPLLPSTCCCKLNLHNRNRKCVPISVASMKGSLDRLHSGLPGTILCGQSDIYSNSYFTSGKLLPSRAQFSHLLNDICLKGSL